MKVVDIANEIFLEMGSPADLVIPAIAFWIRTNLGKLNAVIATNFVIISNSLEIGEDSIEIDQDAVAILKKLYEIHSLDLSLRRSLNALTTDSILEVTDEDGSSVKRVNRGELIKTISAAKKDGLLELLTLTTGYKLKRSSPRQVTGDDTIEGFGLRNQTLSNRSSLI